MEQRIELMEGGMRIRFANESDLVEIKEFIKDEWDSKYSFVTHPDLLKYVHTRNAENSYVVLEKIEDGELLGILGYIIYNDFEYSDIAAALLKVKASVKGMMGVKMLIFLQEHRKQRLLLCCGILPRTLNIYQFLQWKTDKLKYYYRVSDRSNYQICKINNKKIEPITQGRAKLIEYTDFSELQSGFDVSRFADIRPYKDMSYLKWRYYDFPYYRYRVWGIKIDEKESCGALIVGREIEYSGSKMLAIVDFLGEECFLAEASEQIQCLMDDNAYEYIEFMCYGLSDKVLKKAGFVLREENDTNIIPSHFEPFACENVDKYFFVADHDKIRMFRGDSNQDIPRYIDIK